ncbi:MAG: 4Fe-4S binding protein [Archaeoglobaceae archaeon]
MIVVLETCDGCGICREVCPFRVFEIVEGFAIAVKSDECVVCCSCVENCPREALIVIGCDVKNKKV